MTCFINPVTYSSDLFIIGSSRRGTEGTTSGQPLLQERITSPLTQPPHSFQPPSNGHSTLLLDTLPLPDCWRVFPKTNRNQTPQLTEIFLPATDFL